MRLPATTSRAGMFKRAGKSATCPPTPAVDMSHSPQSSSNEVPEDFFPSGTPDPMAEGIYGAFKVNPLAPSASASASASVSPAIDSFSEISSPDDGPRHKRHLGSRSSSHSGSVRRAKLHDKLALLSAAIHAIAEGIKDKNAEHDATEQRIMEFSWEYFSGYPLHYLDNEMSAEYGAAVARSFPELYDVGWLDDAVDYPGTLRQLVTSLAVIEKELAELEECARRMVLLAAYGDAMVSADANDGEKGKGLAWSWDNVSFQGERISGYPSFDNGFDNHLPFPHGNARSEPCQSCPSRLYATSPFASWPNPDDHRRVASPAMPSRAPASHLHPVPPYMTPSALDGARRVLEALSPVERELLAHRCSGYGGMRLEPF